MAETADSPDPHADMRPVVATSSNSNFGMWAFFAILAIGGVWLFSALSANRAELQAPATALAPTAEGGRISSAPPLALPRDLLDVPSDTDRRLVRRPPPAPTPLPQIGRTVITPAPSTAIRTEFPRPVAPPPQPAVVFDQAFAQPAQADSPAASASESRVTAGRFAKPSQTIPQGTVIPAVLETALDSTRPGAARALVQRDIFSFDGTRILIHRGSRLYGEYDSGLEAGQNRALVQWTRLIRPDGVTIALDSPSSDPLGRAGVKGKVDSKFLQRFGGAILQSVLDIGVGIATREASSDGVIVALPGSTQNLQIKDQQRVQRTLKVKHGTSVSVFVARDLDFSTVDS